MVSVNLTLYKSAELFYRMSVPFLLAMFESCSSFIFLAGILYCSMIIIIIAVVTITLVSLVGVLWYFLFNLHFPNN